MSNSKLVECNTCKHHVSDDALSCPSCGNTLGKLVRSSIGVICLWLLWLYQVYIILEGITIATKVASMSLTTTSVFGQAGIAIGSNIAYNNLFSTWAIGTVILGLLAIITKPSIVRQFTDKVGKISNTIPTPTANTVDKKDTGALSVGWTAAIIIGMIIIVIVHNGM